MSNHDDRARAENMPATTSAPISVSANGQAGTPTSANGQAAANEPILVNGSTRAPANAPTSTSANGQAGTSATTPTPALTPKKPTLQRSLKNRHIQLISLGGAIGTGLFYGSSESISLAGPSILLAYLIGGVAIFMIVRAMSEMSVEDPNAGAFSYYATQYWSKRAGFVSGWNYWFNYILVSMVELSVVGSFVNYWFPAIPAWVSAAVFLVVITAANLLGVSKFGEFEFWFALIKILAVVAMILGGLAVIVLNLPTASGIRASFANWFNVGGGFLPHGLMTHAPGPDGQWTGLLMALCVVMFSFGGTELIGITAGEAEDPRRTIPKATNGIIARILVFYIFSLGVIMAVVPWNTIDGKSSPFVQIFDSVGVHAAAGILNFICLTAVMSVYNSALYSNSRMLYSLAQQGNAPRYLGRLNSRGVPANGVLTSAAVTVIAVVVVFLWPEFAFNYLMSIATISALINWGMVLVTEMKFRKAVAAGRGPNLLAGLHGREALDRIAFKLPLHRVMPWAVLAFMAFVIVLMCFSPSYRIAVVVGPIWVATLLVAYQLVSRK
ncbi:amino acid permease [Bifidobacterium sp. ESL0763]|uniref:amino acid permease n=1 Tax=Bifidobacterium sp. ESL0763 TaxID=2983227 RepID=UPI0023F6D51B|nr:amino acid permease [Bifidobacterium sp. ESL0763]MDF7663196.1 amino acid permease [Bifidobacterium sp. ESL0763]